MNTTLIVVAIVALLFAADRIAKGIGILIAFTFNLGLLLFVAALRLTFRRAE